jgi:RNA polymerase sigma-70 factor (ECF subfamily)
MEQVSAMKQTRSEERELARRIAAQDQMAMNQLVEQYGDVLFRTSMLVLKDVQLAEDVVQETFITAYRKIRQYNGEGSLKAWLVAIALNHGRSIMRRAWWKRLTLRDMESEQLSSHHLNPEHQVMDRALMNEIYKLPYPYREVIVLYYYQDMTLHEIAGLLNEREGTVKTRLFRARQRLKKELRGGEWFDA